MRMQSVMTLGVTIALASALGACGRDDAVEDGTAIPPAVEAPTDEAVRVTDVGLGRSIDAQGRIAGGADTNAFGPNDTIYISVNTSGTATGSQLTARWTFEDGQLVDESSQTISSTGAATTEFHISNPDGFPPGGYRVDIQLDGRTVETREFTIS